MLPTLMVVFSVSSPQMMHKKSAEMYIPFSMRLSESNFWVLGGFLLVLLVSYRRTEPRKRITENNFTQFSNKLQEASGNFALDFFNETIYHHKDKKYSFNLIKWTPRDTVR
jgi:hypothetical protein